MPTPKRTLRQAWPRLAEQWHPDNPITPDDIYMGAAGEYLWVHPACGHTFTASLKNRVKNRENSKGCLVCAGRSVLLGYNDLASRYPNIASEWDAERNDLTPEQVTYRSGRRANWVCSTCGHRWDATIANRTNGHACPKCGYKKRGRSTSATAVDRSGSLADVAPEIASEWGPENSLSPSDVSPGAKYRAQWVCSKGHTWRTAVCDRQRSGCPHCSKIISKAETEVADFVRGLGLEIQTSNRGLIAPLELDIVIPERGVAIEFNGLYWHSIPHKEIGDHARKTDKATEAGYQLIHVWEDDWRDRREIVERMISRKLGVSTEERVNARDLSVVEVTVKEARPFLDANHIQGFVSGSAYLTLQDSNGAVRALMVMVRRKNGDWELSRYATNSIVRGGHSKLFKGFVRTHPEVSRVVTFADRGVSDGGLYETCGFRRDCEIPPDYMYVVNDRREHKFNYRKKRFRDDPNLEYREGLTERELAALNGLNRIYDAGKVRWVWVR